jgi:hypothetical protein
MVGFSEYNHESKRKGLDQLSNYNFSRKIKRHGGSDSVYFISLDVHFKRKLGVPKLIYRVFPKYTISL